MKIPFIKRASGDDRIPGSEQYRRAAGDICAHDSDLTTREWPFAYNRCVHEYSLSFRQAISAAFPSRLGLSFLECNSTAACHESRVEYVKPDKCAPR